MYVLIMNHTHLSIHSHSAYNIGATHLWIELEL